MLTTKITNIATSIRTKTGKTDKLTLDEMPNEILSIETGEDLTEELTIYDTELITQEQKIADIIETLKTKTTIIEPVLQDKSITITENGTTNIVADEGFDGLNNVEVTTNIAGSSEVEPDYITDGLVAWFDGEDSFDSNRHWNNRVGDDYIYVYSQSVGNSSTNPMIKDEFGKCFSNNFVYCLATSKDYMIQGYTIEAVGKITSSANKNNNNAGGWLISGNMASAVGIGICSTTGELGVLNSAQKTESKSYTGLYNKRFGASVHMKQVPTRSSLNTYADLEVSYNGRPYFTSKQTANISRTSKGNCMAILSYYTDTSSESTYNVNGELNCLRIYNRRLTEEEIAHNHAIDMSRFNIDS